MEIIDREFIQQPGRKILFLSVRPYCIWVSILVSLNAGALCFLVTHDVSKHEDTLSTIFPIALFFGVFLPMVAFMLSLIFAWLPYKDKLFEDKIIPVSLLIYLAINILLLPGILLLGFIGVQNGVYKF